MRTTKMTTGREVDSFGDIRVSCPVLHHVLVPDNIWPEFEKWHRQHDYVAHHRSSLLLAMQYGYLGETISSVHRYLMFNNIPHPKLTAQYCQDLQESWMLDSDPLKRHKKFRAYSGKLVEIQFAEWLEKQGWNVTGLEALGAQADIEAIEPGGAYATSFEIKLIGVEDDDFQAILNSFAGKSSVHSVSPYDATNYLLFRSYEAAVQLRSSDSKRIAVIVVEAGSWNRFKLQFDNGWVDWTHLQLFARNCGASAMWNNFLQDKMKQYPNLPDDLASTIATLNSLWVLTRSDGYVFHKQVVHSQ